ncbi:MAG: phosphomannomutase/phosphoglucomutase [Nocardioidaceae bacterium]
MADLAAIFKAYDVRGRVPDELDAATMRQIGAAFAGLLDRRGGGGPQARSPVVVGHDMRASSPALATALADGVRDAGRDVTFIGLVATDELYFASGSLDAPAAMVTASHNPAADNGLKLCLAGAVALSAGTGLDEIRDIVAAGQAGVLLDGPPRGSLRVADVLASYVSHLHSLAPVRGRRLKVVVDAANAMAGLTAPAVFASLDAELVPLYFELDGSFPHHDANPLEPANLRDLSTAVGAVRADLGLAFDGDADRCFAVDETGRPVAPSTLTALIAVRELARRPGAHVIHNAVTSRTVAETIRDHGGIAVRTPVGHSLIKATMAEVGAVFGGEHSGHYYFQDFWYADSGMLAALHLMATLAAGDRPMSEVAADFERYTASGEINATVSDSSAALDRVESAFAGQPGVSLDRLDGLSVIAEDWWLNVRPSNTEPLLRLNVEAVDDATMADVRDSALALLRAEVPDEGAAAMRSEQ